MLLLTRLVVLQLGVACVVADNARSSTTRFRVLLLARLVVLQLGVACVVADKSRRSTTRCHLCCC